MQEPNKKKPFYGWWIVLGGFIVMAFAHGIVFNCNGLFIKPVTADLGYSRQQFTLNSTILSIATMLMALNSGRLYKKFNVQKLMCVFSITLSAAYFSYSFANSLPMFYLLSAVVGFSIGGMTMIPLSLIVSNWFNDKRGLAIGIAFMGSGVGGMFLNPLVTQIIENYSWRASYRFLGVLMMCTLIPASFFIIRRSPADMGMEPLGGEKVKGVGMSSGTGMMLQEAVRSPKLWIMCVCVFVTSICCSGTVQYINPHITDQGHGLMVAAKVASLTMGGIAVGKIVLGQIYDKLGVRIANFVACSAIVTGLVGMVLVKNTFSFPLIIVGLGLGTAFSTVAYPIIVQHLFGSRDYSSIYGLVTVSSNIGQAAVPIIINGVFDRAGSYTPAYVVLIFLMAISTFVFVSISPKNQKEEAKA